MYKVSIRDLVKCLDEDGYQKVILKQSSYKRYVSDIHISHNLFDEMLENSDGYIHYITVDAEYRKKKYKKEIEFYNYRDCAWQLDEMTPDDMKIVGEMEYLLIIGK